MYRCGSDYDELDRIIYSVYMDYNIREFPIDEQELCRKLGVALIPYSAFLPNDPKMLLAKKSKQAFFVRESKENPPTIYYNDNYDSEGATRLSVFHELKHFVCEDEDDREDDLADYFGRHLMCPTAYLMVKDINTPNEIVAFCGSSFKAAYNASINIKNRRSKYGNKLKDYEKAFIEMVDPLILKIKGGDAKWM